MRTEVIKFTIVQPSSHRGGHNEAEVRTTQEIRVTKGKSRQSICSDIFARCGNLPEQSMWFPWWTKVNRQVPHMYSLSVGAVILFENPNEAYICDCTGWLKCNVITAMGWLNWSGERSYGDMFPLNEWKKSIGMFCD